MSTLLWWSLPILTLVIGTTWAIWKSKPRRSERTQRDIEARKRFEAAIYRATHSQTIISPKEE